MTFLKKVNFRTIFARNFWLKIISLIIAIVVWLYVSGTITGGARSV